MSNVQPILNSNIALQPHAYLIHEAKIPYGVSLEEAIKPEYWQHVTSKLHAGDEIRLIAEDASWLAHTYVVTVHPKFAKLYVMDCHILENKAVREVDLSKGGYTVTHRGRGVYCVVRDEDQCNLTEGLSLTKEQAISQRNEYAKNLSKVA